MKLHKYLLIFLLPIFAHCATKKQPDIMRQNVDNMHYEPSELLRLYQRTLDFLNSKVILPKKDSLHERCLLFSVYQDSMNKELLYSFFPEIKLHTDSKDFGSIKSVEQIQNRMQIKSMISKGNYQVEHFESQENNMSLINIYCSKLSSSELDFAIKDILNLVPSNIEPVNFNLDFNILSLVPANEDLLAIYANIMIKINPTLNDSEFQNKQKQPLNFKLAYEITESSDCDFQGSCWIRRGLSFYRNSNIYSYEQVMKLKFGFQTKIWVNNDLVVNLVVDRIGNSSSHIRSYSYFQNIK